MSISLVSVRSYIDSFEDISDEEVSSSLTGHSNDFYADFALCNSIFSYNQDSYHQEQSNSLFNTRAKLQNFEGASTACAYKEFQSTSVSKATTENLSIPTATKDNFEAVLYQPYENNVVVNKLQHPTGVFYHQQTKDWNNPSPRVNSSQQQMDGNVHKKRNRTQYTALQLMELEREFSEGIYLSRMKRIKLAEKLILNETQIKVWFQNRRMKLNKEKGKTTPETVVSKIEKVETNDHLEDFRLFSNNNFNSGFPQNLNLPKITGYADIKTQNIYPYFYNNNTESNDYISGYSSNTFFTSAPNVIETACNNPVNLPEDVNRKPNHEPTPNVTISWGPCGKIIKR